MGKKRKHVLSLCMALAFAAAPLSCVNDDGDGGGGGVRAGDRLPQFSVVMSTGETLQSASLAGKPAVIIFFNTSCPDCRRELPVLQRVYNRFGAGGQAVFAAISRAQGGGSVEEYWKAEGLTIPYSAQSDDSVYRLFARSVIPRIYITDTRLNVAYVYTDNPLPSEEELAGAVSRMLDASGRRGKRARPHAG